MYGKIFASMYRGTLYGHWEAIVTMQQLIVLADADGIVDMTPQAIAAHTSIPLDIITKGISKLEEADPYSRTPGEEGRRIVGIDEHRPWGWQIVNYEKYKHLKDSEEVREQTRDRVRRFRDRRNGEKRDVTDVTLGNAEKRHTDIDIDINDTAKFGRFWTAYPKKVAKQDAVKAWKKLSPSSEQCEALMSALELAKKSSEWTRESGRFIPHASTWLNGRRFEDEVKPAVESGLYSRKGVM